jgi:hypothetical protein
MESLRHALIAVIAWLLIAIALDRFLLAPYCPACVDAAALELKLAVPAGQLHCPPVSLLTLVALPMLAMALWLIPWRHPVSGGHWADAVSIWVQPWAWIVVTIVLTMALESLYLVTREFLPKGFNAIADKFSIAAVISVAMPGFKATTPLSLTASLAGLIGFAVGAWYFLSRGMRDLFE